MHDVFAALAGHAERRPDAVAFSQGETDLTYADLAARVGGLAQRLADAGQVIGLLAPNSLDWVIADLAIALAGRCLVPLPPFFSREQIAHICADAGIEAVLVADGLESLLPDGRPACIALDTRASAHMPSYAGGARRVIYTSGTSGRPKGVRHGDRQIGHTLRGLIAASEASAADVYLSVLPFALLLEQICAILLPIAVGARARLADPLEIAGNPRRLAELAVRHEPSACVLVPSLLAAWVGAFEAGAPPPPDSLRFVAVGGAPVAPGLAERAWLAGIPVHEGYGLSECGSVVALNRPGERRSGSVGRPLDGLRITIEEGEIVVDGPSVMDGYLAGPAVGERWRTGDIGRLDADGHLVVDGRRDNLLVKADGRNVSPEWVEAPLCADPRILAAVLTGHGEETLTLIVVPRGEAEHAPDLANDGALRTWASSRLRGLPDYARPGTLLVLDPQAAGREGIVDRGGRVDRRAAARAGHGDGRRIAL